VAPAGPKGGARRRLQAAGAALLLALVATLAAEWPFGAAPPAARPAAGTRGDEARIEAAFREGRGDFFVELPARVTAILPDDDDGSRHQRFLVELSGGRTLLVAHNIDLAPRVPVREGDAVLLRGEYAWNERGGVVHWTHRDPQGRREGGFVEHAGRRYR
jgi:hypothetical protein